MKVYHVIHEEKPQYKDGDIVVSPFESKRDFSHWKPYKQQAEELLEKERANHFPSLPSRYDSLFVAETPEQIEEWIRNKYRNGATYYLYELELLSGEIFYSDTDWFEGLGELLSNGELPITHKYSVEDCIANFWEGKPFRPSGFSLKEGMLKGEVRVISKRKYNFDRFQNKIKILE